MIMSRIGIIFGLYFMSNKQKNKIMKNLFAFIAFTAGFGIAATAQSSTKTETMQAAELLQSSRTENPTPAATAETPQSRTKQEPVKQQEPAKKEDKKQAAKPAPAAAPAPAPAADKQSETESKPGATKMAITEQGVDKNKKKKSAAATTVPPPATEEKK
jgi:outer membrane biosynthesis protein TonB